MVVNVRSENVSPSVQITRRKQNACFQLDKLKVCSVTSLEIPGEGAAAVSMGRLCHLLENRRITCQSSASTFPRTWQDEEEKSDRDHGFHRTRLALPQSVWQPISAAAEETPSRFRPRPFLRACARRCFRRGGSTTASHHVASRYSHNLEVHRFEAAPPPIGPSLAETPTPPRRQQGGERRNKRHG